MAINIDMDENILLSLINTKLRNDYVSLIELGNNERIDLQALQKRLKDAGYTYDEKTNQFK